MASALMKTRACTGKFDIHATRARLKILRGGIQIVIERVRERKP
jgi:hypothetical protein